jgi:hypothetical protein
MRSSWKWLTPRARILKDGVDVKTAIPAIDIKRRIGYPGGMKIPRHIVWSFDKAECLDLSDPENRKWWIKQVLMNGRMEDIRALDFDEVERILPKLYLPKPIKKLWSDYFAKRRTPNTIPEKSP